MRTDMLQLLIDSHYIGHQMSHVMGKMSHDELKTGVLFGFLSRILQFGQLFDTNQLIFCWDSKHSYRKKWLPGYKLRPEKSEEEKEDFRVLMKQLKLLRKKILPAIGFNNHFIQPGYESDDILASIVQNKLGDWVIVSGDEDMFQLLQRNCRLYMPGRKEKKMMTVKRFEEEYGILPNQWSRVKAIGGCSSDKVPGVSGVGEKTAIKYLKGELKATTKAYSNIVCEDNKIDLYHKLVKLPIPGTKEPKFREDKFSMEGFFEVCEEYGLGSFLEEEKLQQWTDFFNMDMRETPPSRYSKKRRRPRAKNK